MCESLEYPDVCWECGTRRTKFEHFKNPYNGNCEAWCESCVDEFNRKVVS